MLIIGAVSYTHLFLEVLVSYHGISKLTIAKMAGVEENDIDRLLANPPEKDEIEVKYKIAVTVDVYKRQQLFYEWCVIRKQTQTE